MPSQQQRVELKNNKVPITTKQKHIHIKIVHLFFPEFAYSNLLTALSESVNLVLDRFYFGIFLEVYLNRASQ